MSMSQKERFLFLQHLCFTQFCPDFKLVVIYALFPSPILPSLSLPLKPILTLCHPLTATVSSYQAGQICSDLGEEGVLRLEGIMVNFWDICPHSQTSLAPYFSVAVPLCQGQSSFLLYRHL